MKWSSKTARRITWIEGPFTISVVESTSSLQRKGDMAVQKVTFFPGQRIQYSLDYSSTTLLENFISTEH